MGKVFVTWCEFVSPQPTIPDTEAVNPAGRGLPVVGWVLGVDSPVVSSVTGREQPVSARQFLFTPPATALRSRLRSVT